MKVELFNVVAIAVSAPLCIVLLFSGLVRLKRTPGKPQHMKGTLPGGASFEVGEEEKRRETDKPDGVQRLVDDLLPPLIEAISKHQCGKADMIAGISRGTIALATAQEVSMRDAIQSGRNGEFKRAYEEVIAFRKDFSEMMSDKALGVQP